MLKLDTQSTLTVDNQTLIYWGDTANDDPASASNIFYLWPDAPRLALDEQGIPKINLIKYTSNVTLPGGKGLQGGYLTFDAEFAVDPATEAKAKAMLQQQHGGKPVTIGTIPFTNGKVDLHFPDGGGLVNDVQSTGKPSLSGSNIASIALALTPEGAKLFQDTVINAAGTSSIQIIYSLNFDAMLPAIKAHIWYDHTMAQEYYKKQSNRWNTWKTGYDLKTQISNDIRESGAGGADVTFSQSNLDPAVKKSTQDWALQTLTSMMAQSVFKADTPDPGDAGRGNTLDFEEKISQSADFNVLFSENQAVNFFLQPSVTLPGLAHVTDKSGQPVNVDHFLEVVDLTDNTFGYLIVATGTNLPNWDLVSSVTLTLEYGDGVSMERQSYTLTGDHPTGEPFKQTLKHDNSNNPIYGYRYMVEAAFKNGWPQFKSGWRNTEDPSLSIGLSDLNVLAVNVIGTSLDWKSIQSVDVHITCQGITLDQVTLNQTNTHQLVSYNLPSAPPVSGVYTYDYTQTFHLASGAVFTVKGSTSQPSLYVTSPFSATRSWTIRGDQDPNMADLYVTLEYDDTNNNYSQKLENLDLFNQTTKGSYTWVIPTPQGSTGEVYYSGAIVYNDGTPQKIIQRTQAPESPVIQVYQGRPKFTVNVDTSLVSWATTGSTSGTQSKLILVKLSHPPGGTGSDLQTTTLKLTATNQSQSWSFFEQDRSDTSYSYQVTYYMANGKKFIADLVTDSTADLELQDPPPQAVAVNAVAITREERALF